MSFSSDVKAELLRHSDLPRHCIIASVCALINLCGEYRVGEESDESIVVISSDNDTVVGLADEYIGRLFEDKQGVSLSDNGSALVIKGKRAEELLSVAGFTGRDSLTEEMPINPLIVASDCCKRAYLRTAFICCGSVTDPEKNYHFEFVNSDYYHALNLKRLIADFGIEAKIVERKNHYVVYLKEGEQIVDMLNLISAYVALMEFENKRIVKEVRNNVNRKVNCETANLNKVVSASVKHRDAIEYIKNKVGFSYLSKQLEEVARARLDNPDLSLKELGEVLNPPVSKSGVNHRLKKICEIAEQLKGDEKNG
jgi:DNA-binding protein WhiA